ncbi:MAG: hypothetical protein ACE3L7_19115 [Candidatus Pristimantibacillus sp.]
MLIRLDRKKFEFMDDAILGWTCIEPTLMQVRARSPEIKAQVYGQLTAGQRALMMFHVMHDHAKHSAMEYYGWIGYLLDQPGTWKEVVQALRLFGDEAMLHCIEQMKAVIEQRNGQVSLNDLAEDAALAAIVGEQYDEFIRITPQSITLNANYIRSHNDEFIHFTD